MRTLKVIAALLHYPDEALLQHDRMLIEALAVEAQVTAAELRSLEGFIDDLRGRELIDVQARFVETFDRGRARSLYLFEHVHGESRDRGQALVELSRLYRRHGYLIDARELPDYLPLYLEFLSTLPAPEALQRLAEIGELLQRLHGRLADRRSPYAVLLEPLVRLGGFDTHDAEVREQIAAEVPDDTRQALDEAWMETPVTFGARDAKCRPS